MAFKTILDNPTISFNVIFNKTKYFWLGQKDIKKFTISTLAKKLLQVSSNHEK